MPLESLLLVRFLNDLQHLFVVMTVNSVWPTFANHEFYARWPPFGQKISISDLPIMPFIRNPQNQAPLLAPSAYVRFAFQIRGEAACMTCPEALAALIGNDATLAGPHSVRDRSLSAHWRTPVR